MSSTDIPNGYLIRGPNGNTILVDIDENGKPGTEATEMSIGGWPETIMKGGRIKPDLLVLVHSVRGSERVLLKRISVRQLQCDGNPITVKEIVRKGWLNGIVEKIWKDYVSGIRDNEVKS